MSEDPLNIAGLLVLDAEQEQFRQMARQTVDKEAPVTRFRAMRDRGATHDPALWRVLADLGWPAVTFAEEHGGLGLSLVEATLLAEALGRNLAAAPLVSAGMVGALDAGAGIQEGRVVALAWQESTRGRDAGRVAAEVVGGRLTGAKVAVMDATAAEAFLVSAREGGAIGLYRVAASDAQVDALTRLDSRDAGNVRFEGATATRVLGGLAELEAALDIGTILLAAEMLGGAAAAFERTLAWLHERQQFDVPLGSFQVLQHRAVDLFIGLELARSAVMGAAAAQAEGRPVAALASLAKARVSDTFLAVAREAIQLHGGIGMTDECDVGLYLKRAAVTAETLGNSAWHRDRWAILHGY